MRDLALDTASHDLVIEPDVMLLDGAEQVAQQLKIKLKLWRGEWFLDDDFGTPYLTDILGKQLTLSGVVAALRQSILEVQDVVAIESFEYTYDNSTRVFGCNFTARSRYGIIKVMT